jgi:hypothetical protein
MTTTDSRTGTSLLRIEIEEPGSPPSLEDLSALFEHVESLIFVSAIIERIDPDDVQFGNYKMISPDVLVSAQYIATNGFRVARMRYNSPIEIAFYIGSGVLSVGVPGAYVVAKRLLKLANETSNARAKFAEARMKEADARLRESDVDLLVALNHRALLQLATAHPGSNLDRVDPNPTERKALQKTINQRVEEAASVLAVVEQVAIEEG